MIFPRPFSYDTECHVRRHGPCGYRDAQYFKPWLRDEFQFRCVYCLIRERWHPDGDFGFSVEHLRPRAKAQNHVVDYDNLFYACCRCNAAKRDLEGILNPAEVPLADHLLVSSEGTITGLTEAGLELIRVCQLDRDRLVEFRRGVFQLLQLIQSGEDSRRPGFLARYFGFPTNLPRLASLRPPQGNSRPNGIALRWHELQSAGRLPDVY